MHNTKTRDKREQGENMNDRLFRTILKRYEAECRKSALEYAQYKDPRQTGARRKHER